MNGYSHKFFTTLCFGQNMELIDSCILSDEDEAQDGFSCHFYNPVTTKCYLGTEDSAKNRFLWHLSNYLITNKKESLGRAIHFLEDICTPVHTQYEDPLDAAIRLKLHVNFEKQLDEYLEKTDESKQLLKFNSIGELLEYCPCNASELYYMFKDDNAKDTVFSAVYSLTKSALSSLKSILNSQNLIAKSFSVNGEKINALFEKGHILPSCLNTNFCLRYNGCDNVTVFYRSNKLANFNVIGNLF